MSSSSRWIFPINSLFVGRTVAAACRSLLVRLYPRARGWWACHQPSLWLCSCLQGCSCGQGRHWLCNWSVSRFYLEWKRAVSKARVRWTASVKTYPQHRRPQLHTWWLAWLRSGGLVNLTESVGGGVHSTTLAQILLAVFAWRCKGWCWRWLPSFSLFNFFQSACRSSELCKHCCWENRLSPVSQESVTLIDTFFSLSC